MTLAAAVALLALAAPPATSIGPVVDPLAELAATLGRLGASRPVRARVEHRFTSSQGDDPPGPEGLVTATATSGADGLQVAWSRELLAEAEREEARLADTPDARTPVRDALFDLRVLRLGHVLDAAPELLRVLRGAELVEARDDAWNGAPARLLVLKVTPPLGARERRYVKEVLATARVWLGPDGVPVAAEQEIKARGRVFLIISFEIEQRERLRFALDGDRLVALHRESEQRSSGAGEKGWRRSVTDVAPLP
jgi:hypothetical protein